MQALFRQSIQVVRYLLAATLIVTPILFFLIKFNSDVYFISTNDLSKICSDSPGCKRIQIGGDIDAVTGHPIVKVRVIADKKYRNSMSTLSIDRALAAQWEAHSRIFSPKWEGRQIMVTYE